MNFKEEIKRSKEIEAKALESCNSHPIEIPGYIQNFGALLAFDFETLRITYVSENIGEYLNKDANEVLGLSAKEVFNREDFHAISNVASYNAVFDHREKVKIVKFMDKELDLSLYRIGNLIVTELSPVGQHSSTIQINSHLKWVFDAIKGLQKVDDVLKETVNGLRLITGFDRVKAYIFHPDDSGEVVAESNNGNLEPYLGLRFPAYDIPPIARAIFLKVSIRYISDTSDEGVKVISTPDIDEPLNLGLALLRGNSLIHNQYLRNMGVKSSMTIPIVIKGKLWGLFSMHSKTRVVLTSEIAYSAELLGQIISMNLEQLIDRHTQNKLSELRLEGNQFITLNPNPTYLEKFWKDYAGSLKKLIKCNGVAYQLDQKILTHEDCPDIETIQEITKIIKTKDNRDVCHYINLDDFQIENLGPTRGLLALKINETKPTIVIYFFRNEVNKEVAWAGNPKKDIVVENEEIRLHPRSSFNHFKKLNKGTSEIWNTESIALAEAALKTFKQSVVLENATSERLKTIVQELNHRLRNVLTLVRSISRQMAEDSTSVEEYVDSLEYRILALAKSNSLLSANNYKAVGFRELLLKIIPSLSSGSHNISLKGEDIKLVSNCIPIMVLIIHELTTNALKYGSLSVNHGALNINWFVENEGLVIEWKETNGPLVKTPTKMGFGTSVIKNAIEYEFSGSSEINFLEEGMVAKFRLPLDLIGENKEIPFVSEQIKEISKDDSLVKTKWLNVLILEDNFMISKNMEKSISALSVKEVNAFSNQKKALSSLSEMNYHLAFLDVNLKNETSIDVAIFCKENNIPFYYTTGYGRSFLEEGVFPVSEVLLKPLKIEELQNIIGNYLSH